MVKEVQCNQSLSAGWLFLVRNGAVLRTQGFLSLLSRLGTWQKIAVASWPPWEETHAVLPIHSLCSCHCGHRLSAHKQAMWWLEEEADWNSQHHFVYMVSAQFVPILSHLSVQFFPTFFIFTLLIHSIVLAARKAELLPLAVSLQCPLLVKNQHCPQ